MATNDYVSQEIARVRALVMSAFSSVSRPTRVTKRVAIALDDEWIPDDERCAELRALDLEQTWHDLKDSEIEEFGGVLPWLDEEGLRFYLPAFIDYALRMFSALDHRAISSIHDLSSSRDSLLRALSTDQLKAYSEFEALYGYSFELPKA